MSHSQNVCEQIEKEVQDAATLDLKYRPVSKVVKLLKDMQAELNAEKAKDQAVFDKLTCWSLQLGLASILGVDGAFICHAKSGFPAPGTFEISCVLCKVDR